MLELHIGQAKKLVFQAQDFVDHALVAVAKVIDANDMKAVTEQFNDRVRPNEAGSSCHQQRRSFHGQISQRFIICIVFIQMNLKNHITSSFV
jgi:hypothetical protein